jgi:hypothetical protein
LKNIEEESNDLEILGKTEPSSRDQQVAKIEGDLASERDSRRQERFYWVLAFVIALVVFALDEMQSVGMQMLASLLLIVLLIGYANHCGVEAVAVPLRRLYNWLLVRWEDKDD